MLLCTGVWSSGLHRKEVGNRVRYRKLGHKVGDRKCMKKVEDK